MFSTNWLFYLIYYSSLFYTHSLFRPVPRIQEICSHLPIIDQAISQAKHFLPFISMFVNSMHSFMFDSSITYTIKLFLISQLNSIIVIAFSICYLGLLLFIIVFFTQYLLRIFYVSSIAVRYGIKDGKKNIVSTLKMFTVWWWDRHENKYNIMLKRIWKYRTTDAIIWINDYIII